MDYFVRPAVRNEWYHSLFDYFDQISIQDHLKYSMAFYILLAYHSMFCTFVSTLMVFVNAATNPCHGYFSAQSFQTSDIFSVLLSVSGFLSSWSILSVLHDSKPSQKNRQLVYFPFLVTTIVGTFLAFCLFMFIISEFHFLNLWRLILDTHTLQNIQYFSGYQTLTCFKKLELVQLGVLSFSYLVAGGVGIIRFLCHESLWRLITPKEEVPLQKIRRTPEEFFQYYGYYPLGVIPASNLNAENNDNNLSPRYSPNQLQNEDQDSIVSALVHSAFAPDVIPYPLLKTAECFQNVDKTLEEAPVDAQFDMKGKSEPNAAIDADSEPQPLHPTNIRFNVHLHWIDELKQYHLAKSNEANREVPEFIDAINLPEFGAHSKSCGNGSEGIPQQQRSVSVSPLGSSVFSKEEIQEKLQKIFEVHNSKHSNSRGSRLEKRRGAISGPSRGSAFDECEVDDGEKTETFVQPLASFSSTKSEKQILTKPANSPRRKYHGSPPSVDLVKSGDGASVSSIKGSYQTNGSGSPKQVFSELENRCRLSSESTDSDLFLYNLLYADNDISLV